MKRTIVLLGALLGASSGCSHMNNTEAGALGGGLIGAGLGAVVGGVSGHPGAGAAIGAASGALIGGVAGNSEDRAEKREAQAAQQWAERNQRTIADVVKMTHDHTPDHLIIGQINNSYFDLRPEDITYLRQQGVSDTVIAAMQARRSPPPGAYRVRPAGSVVIYEAPPPPVSVGFGFGYGGYRHRGWW
jgi:hypothetical protein